MIIAYLTKIESSNKIAFVKALLCSKGVLVLPELALSALALVLDLSDFETKHLKLVLGIIAKKGFKGFSNVVLW